MEAWLYVHWAVYIGHFYSVPDKQKVDTGTKGAQWQGAVT